MERGHAAHASLVLDFDTIEDVGGSAVPTNSLSMVVLSTGGHATRYDRS